MRKLAYTLIIALLVCSCKQSTSEPNSPVAAVTVGGSSLWIRCTTASISTVRDRLVLSVILSETECQDYSGRMIFISVDDPSVRTYTTSDPGFDVTVRSPSTRYFADYLGGSGAIIIEHLSETMISGKFAAIVVSEDGTKSISVNGEFTAPCHRGSIVF